MFDIIVDDASQISKDFIVSFLILFKNLNPDEVYVIEDLAYEEGKYGGGLWDENSSIEFFKLMVELVNVHFIPPVNQKKIDDEIVQRIGENNLVG